MAAAEEAEAEKMARKEALRAAEEVILEKQRQGRAFKEYLAPTGMPAFAKALYCSIRQRPRSLHLQGL